MEDYIYLDEKGYENFLKSIQEEEQKLKEIRLFKGNVAIYQGDAWHDNPTFEQTEMEERMAMKTISDLKSKLSRIVIINSSEEKKNTVMVGSKVSILLDFGDESEKAVFTLVANNSIDINNNELSINSPLGKAIYQKSKNDIVSYTVNSNVIKATILDIE